MERQKFIIFSYCAVGGSTVPRLPKNEEEEDKFRLLPETSDFIEEDGDVSNEPSSVWGI